MEITIHINNIFQDIMFKIDLIVWKYDRIALTSTGAIKFKIDLIVWKFISDRWNCLCYQLFKIDLIVWKYS